MWLRRGCNKGGFGDHDRLKSICSVCVEESGGCTLTMMFRKVMVEQPF